MNRRTHSLVLGLTAAMILVGCGRSGPSGESQKALSLLESNMTEDALALLEKRIQNEPGDQSAVFLLKVVRTDSTASELIKLADENAWVSKTMADAVASALEASVPTEFDLKTFTQDSIDGDANEAESEAKSGGLSRYMSPYTTELLEWWLKLNPEALSDIKTRFALYMRFDYGHASKDVKVKEFAQAFQGDLVDLAYWETSARYYHEDNRDMALNVLKLLKGRSKSEVTQRAIAEALGSWRAVMLLEVPVSESGTGMEVNPRRPQEVSLFVPAKGDVEVQVLNSIAVRPWGREQVVYPSDELTIVDVEGYEIDQWWEARRKKSLLFGKDIPFPGQFRKLPTGERPAGVVTCTSGFLWFSSTLPSPRSEDVWKLRLEFLDPQT